MARKTKKSKIPPLPPGWKTCNMMRIESHETAEKWQGRMERLRQELIREICNEVPDTPVEEAEKIIDLRWVGLRKASGHPVLAASPQAQERMMEKVAPLLEEGWATSHMMFERHGGGMATWTERIYTLADELAKDISVQLKISPREARQMVEDHLVGMRRYKSSGATISLGPDAQRLLEQQLVEKQDPGWKTGTGMKKAHGGDSTRWDERIRALAKTLTQDIADQLHVSPDEAQALVERHLVGMRQPRTGQPAMAASPDAQRLLEKQIVEKMGPGWKTGVAMSKAYGGGYGYWDRQMRVLAKELTEDIAGQLQVSPDEAQELVERHLVGMRQPKGGMAAMAASEDAQRILRDRTPPELETDWKTPAMMTTAHGRACAVWDKLMCSARESLTEDIVAIGVPERQAQLMVDRHLIGERHSKRGGTVLAASPFAQRWLLETHKIRDIRSRAGRNDTDSGPVR